MVQQITAPGEVATFEANADLSACIYCVVFKTATDDNRVDLASQPSSRAQVPLGILQNKPSAAGRSANVKIGGLCNVRAGAAVTAGRELTFDSSGSLIHQSSAAQYRVGHALTSAGAAGEQFTMKWETPVLANSF